MWSASQVRLIGAGRQLQRADRGAGGLAAPHLLTGGFLLRLGLLSHGLLQQGVM